MLYTTSNPSEWHNLTSTRKVCPNCNTAYVLDFPSCDCYRCYFVYFDTDKQRWDHEDMNAYETLEDYAHLSPLPLCIGYPDGWHQSKALAQRFNDHQITLDQWKAYAIIAKLMDGVE